MQLQNLVPMLSVADVEKSLVFYHDALQFEVVERYDHDRLLRWASMKSGEAKLMLARCEVAQSVLPFSTKENLVLYFYADDVEALHAALKARRYAVSELRLSAYGMTECAVTDPDGYQLWFGQHTAASSRIHALPEVKAS